MENQIKITTSNGELVVSSRQVAENFGKEHSKVIRSIEGIANFGDTQGMFHKVSYVNEQNGQEYKEYLMNRDGFSLLVMGFTGKEAMEWKIKYINAFNEMERKLAKPQLTLAEQMAQGLLAAQQLLSEKNKQVEHLTATIEQQKPKVIFADAVSASKTSILIGDLAKLIRQNGVEVGQKRLFEWLRQNGWLMKSGNSKNMPTQRGMEMKLFEVKEGSYVDSNGVNVVTKTTKVTGKGQQYFVNVFLNGKSVGEEK